MPTPSDPSAGNEAATPCRSTITPCPSSEILVIDELGLPLKNTNVKVILTDGTTFLASTNSQGILKISAPPGTTGEIEFNNIHETSQGESTSTPSGHHFKAGCGAP